MNNNANMDNDTTKTVPQEPKKGLTEQLEGIRNGLRDKEKQLCDQAGELGYPNLSLEQIEKIEPDIDKDLLLAEQVLALQGDAKSLLEQKKYWDTVICVEDSKLHITVDAAEKLLAQHPEHHFYQRGGELVRVIKRPAKKGSSANATHETTVIVGVEQAYLILTLTRLGNFIKFDGHSKGIKAIDCTEKIARSVISKQEWPFLPVLHGITTIPTMRIDGSIIDEPGYDERSGLLFIPDDCIVPKISENPTQAEIQQAKELLLDLLIEFPFENEASKSVVLAAILTALTRDAYPTAPIFAFTAPKMASGKSLLADIVSYILTGKRNNALPQAENEAEEKKRLLPLLFEGAKIACFDNIERPFGSAALCTITTQNTYKDRKLGASENKVVPTNITFLITGNNLIFSGDIVTRVVLCKLNPDVEHPEDRKFTKNLHTYIPEHRGQLIWAGLTVLCGFFAAGKPLQDIQQFARFEDWSNTIRSAIVWLGLADPCANKQDIESNDPVSIALGDFLSAWHEAKGEENVKANDIIHISESNKPLKDALQALVDNYRGAITANMLGAKLRGFKDRIERGLKLVHGGTMQGTTLWRVVKAKK